MLEKALAVSTSIIGVSARDPESLALEWSPALAIARQVPPDKVVVALGRLRPANQGEGG